MGPFVKAVLVRLGARSSRRTIHRLNAAVNYLETGRWLRERGFGTAALGHRREDVFDAVLAEVGDERVLYVELGVFRGDAMRHWSRRLRHPDAVLHGFDSFEGLPEDWSIDERRGDFSTGGAVPRIDDERVAFFKGWFDDTLPTYEPPAHDRLVLNFDADLYSSTAAGLRRFEPLMRPGTYVYFDEFHDRAHEQRAFSELLDHTRLRFELFAASRDFNHVAFRCVGGT